MSNRFINWTVSRDWRIFLVLLVCCVISVGVAIILVGVIGG